ncbi:PIN domain-containing protein [bacterium]|jgi:predicted nucleic acid-binding protein|nr:PIN domain-containing protein [bacterium]
MATSHEAYVDTSALIAFMDASDSHHAVFARLFADPPRLCTTPLVVAEGHGWFLRRFDRTRALEFLALVEALTPLVIVPVGPKEMIAAAAVLRRFSDQDLTLADAVGLHLARARKCRTCWSTDRHLRLAGTPLVIDG